MFLFTPCRILVAELHIINFWNNLIYIYRLLCDVTFSHSSFFLDLFSLSLNSFLWSRFRPLFVSISPSALILWFQHFYMNIPHTRINIFQCSKMLLLVMLNIFINKLIRILKSDRIYCILMEIIYDFDRLLFLWIRQTIFFDLRMFISTHFFLSFFPRPFISFLISAFTKPSLLFVTTRWILLVSTEFCFSGLCLLAKWIREKMICITQCLFFYFLDMVTVAFSLK